MNDNLNPAAVTMHAEQQREEAFRYALLLAWGVRISVLAVVLPLVGKRE